MHGGRRGRGGGKGAIAIGDTQIGHRKKHRQRQQQDSDDAGQQVLTSCMPLVVMTIFLLTLTSLTSRSLRIVFGRVSYTHVQRKRHSTAAALAPRLRLD